MPTRNRASSIVVVDRKLLVVRLQDPESQREYFFPPGGMLEPGESPEQAAERETLEETGYAIKADPSTKTVARYPFVWGGTVYECTTTFFRAALLSPTPREIKPPEYQRAVTWLPVAQVADAFAYHRDLQTVIVKLL